MKAPEQPKKKTDFQIAPPGIHRAVCTQIVSIGMQSSEYQGQVQEREKVKLRFELPDHRVTWEDKEGAQHEGPMVMWSTYTFSMFHKAKLYEHICSWLGHTLSEIEAMQFDLDKVLGQPCMVTVVHRDYQDKTYANITAIAPLMQGMEAPQPEGDLVSFNAYDHTPEQFDALPNWLQDLVTKGLELVKQQQDRVREEKGFRRQQEPVAAIDDPTNEGGPHDDKFTDDDIPF